VSERGTALAEMSVAEQALVRAETAQQVKEIRDIAASAVEYAKEKKLGAKLIARARNLELNADRKLYQIIESAPKNKGAAQRGGKNPPRSDDPPTLADLGLSKDDAKEVRAVGKLSEGEFAEVQTAGKSPTQVAREARERKAKEALTRPIAISIDGLERGDFRQLAQRIPDESVELVFTDPPYDRDSLPLYEDAAKEAARILKPGGSMICYVGQILLPEALTSMSKHLRYWWTIACVHEGGNQIMNKYGIRCGWKPLMWFVKGSRGDVAEVIRDTVSGAREKDSHEWQQAESEAAYFIDKLCSPTGTVVDFFAGGGTTCVAAQRLGRKWIAFETNAQHYEAATARILQLREAA